MFINSPKFWVPSSLSPTAVKHISVQHLKDWNCIFTYPCFLQILQKQKEILGKYPCFLQIKFCFHQGKFHKFCFHPPVPTSKSIHPSIHQGNYQSGESPSHDPCQPVEHLLHNVVQHTLPEIRYIELCFTIISLFTPNLTEITWPRFY